MIPSYLWRCPWIVTCIYELMMSLNHACRAWLGRSWVSSDFDRQFIVPFKLSCSGPNFWLARCVSRLSKPYTPTLTQQRLRSACHSRNNPPLHSNDSKALFAVCFTFRRTRTLIHLEIIHMVVNQSRSIRLKMMCCEIALSRL